MGRIPSKKNILLLERNSPPEESPTAVFSPVAKGAKPSNHAAQSSKKAGIAPENGASPRGRKAGFAVVDTGFRNGKVASLVRDSPAFCQVRGNTPHFVWSGSTATGGCNVDKR